MRKFFILGLLLTGVLSGATYCGKVQDKMQSINPEHIMKLFLDAWRNDDWKSVYRLTYPSFIQKMRLQKLSLAQQAMSDEELFIYEFARERQLEPDRTLKTYKIVSISAYHAGDTTVWASVLVNGKIKKIPLTLDGLSLKVDMTRIE
jgi:hypothetical protein